MPPLTEEQFNKAREAGFTLEQIIGFEKKRLGEEGGSPQKLIAGRYTKQQLAGKIIPQLTKGLYESVPFGKRIISMLPNAPAIQEVQAETPGPQGAFPALARLAGETAPDLAMMQPFIGGASTISKLPAILKLATGVGAYEGTKAGLTQGPERIIPEATKGFATTAALGYAGKGLYKAGKALTKATPEAIKAIYNIPNKFFRGGLTKPEALRVESEYGASNGSLAETIKDKLNQALTYADDMYNKVFKGTPENKFINVKPAIKEAGNRLKRLGLITDTGSLTELGQSEIARDSVYGKLLDFYQSADAISGVEKLAGKSLTQGQMVRAMRAGRETLVNKEQFLFLRDKLNALYKNKPSDIDVSKVVDSFYQAGENSGLKGLQAARALEREAFYQEGKFLNRNTGDLKIATEAKLNRIGTDKPLSLQDTKHIEELQKYVKHPIISDAGKINKLNRAKKIIKTLKQRGGDVALGAMGLEAVKKVTTGKF